MPTLKEETEALEQKKEKIREMGGAEYVARQHKAGKLTARERIDLLFDKGTFVELEILAHHQSTSPAMQGKQTPADGCITSYGKIQGRLAACAA